MSTEGYVKVPVRADCGHQFDVSLVGHDPYTMEFACPVCGATDRFTHEQATTIMEQYEAAKVAAKQVFDDAIRKTFGNSKHFKLRRK